MRVEYHGHIFIRMPREEVQEMGELWTPTREWEEWLIEMTKTAERYGVTTANVFAWQLHADWCELRVPEFSFVVEMKQCIFYWVCDCLLCEIPL